MLRIALGLTVGCIAAGGCSKRHPLDSPVGHSATELCGAEPCGAGLDCVTYFPVREAKAAAVQACERPCSPASDDCESGEMCTMESAGPGFVCRPKPVLSEVPEDIRRVIVLAEIWSYVRFSHPWLAYRSVDWVGALAQAIPRARAAATDAELVDVIGTMLAEIGDPATAVRSVHEFQGVEGVDDPLHQDGDTLVVRARGVTNPWDPNETGRIAEAIGKTSTIVFDVRGVPTHLLDVMFQAWNPLLVQETTKLPTLRQRALHGFPSELFASSGGYREVFETRATTTVQPAVRETWPRMAFVTDRTQVLPPVAVPVQEHGRAIIVAPEPLTTRAIAPTERRPLPGENRYYEVRTAEVVYGGRGPALRADVVTTGDPVAAAIARLRKPLRPQPLELVELPAPSGPPARVPEPDDLPELALRMASAIDLWSTVDVFHAYPDIRPRWEGALADALIEVDAATDWSAHVRAMLRLSARTDDGHSGVRGEHVLDLLGRAHPPFRAAFVQGCLTVAEILEPQLAAELEVGDVIASIDGASVPDRFEQLAPLVSASTPGAHRENVASLMLAGPLDQPLRLAVERDGDRRSVDVSRRRQPPWPETEAVRRDETGEIGIVDLRQLEVQNVESTFDALADTKAIIFDLRGYPKGTAWAIAPYLRCTSKRTSAAHFERPVVVGGELEARLRTQFPQYLPETDVPRYRGRTVLLVDARTISQAEYTGMFFIAANGTTIVGSATAGANGDVTTHGLPDGLWMHFSGQAVSFPDGRPLQRVGLRPDLHVEPTIQGIRDGRDEVLEAALELLETADRLPPVNADCRQD